MSERKIIKIDKNKCTGCGLCIPNCPEGALQLIDGKVTLISDLFCDGLGGCIGHCPEGAITVEKREAEQYDEKKVMENIAKQGKNVIKAHLSHLRDHGEHKYLRQAMEFLKERDMEIPVEKPTKADHPLPCGCPGSSVMEFSVTPAKGGQVRKEETPEGGESGPGLVSQLRQWPIQIKLVPPVAPYLADADLLIAADCVPFSYADFHDDFLKGRILLVGCPKLDDSEFYKERITQILKNNDIKSIVCIHMEVPCCFGMLQIVKRALEASGKEIPFKDITIGIKGDKK
ncbi:MAG: 4Fe-4S ferredoxin [Omnitrophica bacterium RBG_13_46_9]|nr:MAG: 4Fe-4S ferredoxin [Omnitrophica bacterium RBG_13_46_9]